MRNLLESVGTLVVILLIVGACFAIIVATNVVRDNNLEGFHEVRFYNGSELVSTQMIRNGASVSMELANPNFVGWSHKGETALLDMSQVTITRDMSFQARHLSNEFLFSVERNHHSSMPETVQVVLTGKTLVEITTRNYGTHRIGFFGAGTLTVEMHGSWGWWGFDVFHNGEQIFDWFDTDSTPTTVFRGRAIV